jgi:lysophospholipase
MIFLLWKLVAPLIPETIIAHTDKVGFNSVSRGEPEIIMMRQRFIGGMGRYLAIDPHTVLYYRSWVPLKPRLILVMIHGACQHSGLFLELGKYCVRQRIAVYALDLRGFGQSTGKRGHVQSFCEYLDDLDHFVKHIKQTHPHDPVFLLGHSLGGTIAIRYEQERPYRVQGVIVSAPALRLRVHIPFPLHLICQLLSKIAPELCLEVFRWARLATKMRHFPFSLLGKTDRGDPAAYVSGRMSVRLITELLANGQQALCHADKFRLSILCLCGTDDPLIDPASIRQFYEGLPVKDKTLLLLPGVQHQFLQFDGKEQVVEQIVQWLHERSKHTRTEFLASVPL